MGRKNRQRKRPVSQPDGVSGELDTAVEGMNMSEHENGGVAVEEQVDEQQHAHEMPDGENAQGASLEKVRELLFGQQIRTTDQRLVHLEDKINQQLKNAQEQTRRSLATLEEYFKKEVESLLEQLRNEAGTREGALKSEAQERAEAVRIATEQAKSAAEQLHNRVGELDGRVGENNRKLRDELHEQSKTLRDEMAQSQHDVLETLEAAVAELKRGKTDRKVLADMFGQLAERLAGEGHDQPGVRLAQG